MADFNLTYGDDGAVLSAILREPSGQPINLTTADNVKAYLLRFEDASGSPVFGEAAVEKSTVIATPASGGAVSRAFVSADFGVGQILNGRHFLEFRINGPSTYRRTVPTPPRRYILLVRNPLAA